MVDSTLPIFAKPVNQTAECGLPCLKETFSLSPLFASTSGYSLQNQRVNSHTRDLVAAYMILKEQRKEMGGVIVYALFWNGYPKLSSQYKYLWNFPRACFRGTIKSLFVLWLPLFLAHGRNSTLDSSLSSGN